MSLITQLNDVMARRGYTQTHVARAIGRSSAVINQYLQGKYQGDMADIEERISAFVTREREKENSRRIKAKFVATGSHRADAGSSRTGNQRGALYTFAG